MHLKPSSFGKGATPAKPSSFSSGRQARNFCQAPPNSPFKSPRPVSFEREGGESLSSAIVLDTIEEEHPDLIKFREAVAENARNNPQKSLSAASDCIGDDDCSTTVEDTYSEEDDCEEDEPLTESEFKAIVADFAEQNSVKIATALFEKAIEHLRPVKKQKLNK